MSSRPPLDPAAARRAPLDVPFHLDAGLPERVLQFGTGAFLRGFADVYVDDANRAGRFGGRVVMVGSTGSGRAARLAAQEGLYTVCTQGRRDGALVDRCRVVTSISRALAASEAWADVLEAACGPDLEVVVSNTTEVGIVLDEGDRPDLDPPRSFPGKLTACLHARAERFGYAPERGLVVLPCELVERNGEALCALVLTLAGRWGLGERFAAWVREACAFPNTLVDRIVPGAPPADERGAYEERLGYRDALLVRAEPYRLWAIEGDAALRDRIAWLAAGEGVVVADDIEPFRERKVRILNGAHTALVPLALACGLETVHDVMTDPDLRAYVHGLVHDEIAPSLATDAAAARAFADEVLDRFANPFVRHRLVQITLQQTTKLGVRVLPSIRSAAARAGAIPPRLALGVAALVLDVERSAGDDARPPDDGADRLRAHGPFATATPDARRAAVARAASDGGLWSPPPAAIPGFVDAVADALGRLVDAGPRAAVRALVAAASPIR